MTPLDVLTLLRPKAEAGRNPAGEEPGPRAAPGFEAMLEAFETRPAAAEPDADGEARGAAMLEIAPEPRPAEARTDESGATLRDLMALAAPVPMGPAPAPAPEAALTAVVQRAAARANVPVTEAPAPAPRIAIVGIETHFAPVRSLAVPGGETAPLPSPPAPMPDRAQNPPAVAMPGSPAPAEIRVGVPAAAPIAGPAPHATLPGPATAAPTVQRTETRPGEPAARPEAVGARDPAANRSDLIGGSPVAGSALLAVPPDAATPIASTERAETRSGQPAATANVVTGDRAANRPDVIETVSAAATAPRTTPPDAAAAARSAAGAETRFAEPAAAAAVVTDVPAANRPDAIATASAARMEAHETNPSAAPEAQPAPAMVQSEIEIRPASSETAGTVPRVPTLPDIGPAAAGRLPAPGPDDPTPLAETGPAENRGPVARTDEPNPRAAPVRVAGTEPSRAPDIAPPVDEDSAGTDAASVPDTVRPAAEGLPPTQPATAPGGTAPMAATADRSGSVRPETDEAPPAAPADDPAPIARTAQPSGSDADTVPPPGRQAVSAPTGAAGPQPQAAVERIVGVAPPAQIAVPAGSEAAAQPHPQASAQGIAVPVPPAHASVFVEPGAAAGPEPRASAESNRPVTPNQPPALADGEDPGSARQTVSDRSDADDVPPIAANPAVSARPARAARDGVRRTDDGTPSPQGAAMSDTEGSRPVAPVDAAARPPTVNAVAPPPAAAAEDRQTALPAKPSGLSAPPTTEDLPTPGAGEPDRPAVPEAAPQASAVPPSPASAGDLPATTQAAGGPIAAVAPARAETSGAPQPLETVASVRPARVETAFASERSPENPSETAAPAATPLPEAPAPVTTAAAVATGPAGPASPLRQIVDAVTAQWPAAPASAPTRLPASAEAGPLRILTLQLHPADLGTVLVRMRLQDGRLEMNLRTGREDTAERLRREGGALSELLREAGYAPQALTIEAGGQLGTASDRGAPQTFSAGLQNGQSGGASADQPPGRRPSREGQEPAPRAKEQDHDGTSSDRNRGDLYL